MICSRILAIPKELEVFHDFTKQLPELFGQKSSLTQIINNYQVTGPWVATTTIGSPKKGYIQY